MAVSRSAESADWAFHADDQEVLDALVSGHHVRSLREYFGAEAYARLSALAASARRAGRPRGTRVLILPGIMGSKIGAGPEVLWIDPLQISAGRLTDLRLPFGKALRAAGVLLFSYARLKFELAISGRDALFHSYDWRLGIDELGGQTRAAHCRGRSPGDTGCPQHGRIGGTHGDADAAQTLGAKTHHGGHTQ